MSPDTSASTIRSSLAWLLSLHFYTITGEGASFSAVSVDLLKGGSDEQYLLLMAKGELSVGPGKGGSRPISSSLGPGS